MVTPDDTLSPRYYPAIVPLNDTEIVIFSGYNNAYLSDIVVFDTTNDSLTPMLGSAGKGYYPNTNQSAQIDKDTIVILAGSNGNYAPVLLHWQKGQTEIEVLHKF